MSKSVADQRIKLAQKKAKQLMERGKKVDLTYRDLESLTGEHREEISRLMSYPEAPRNPPNPMVDRFIAAVDKQLNSVRVK